MLKSYKDLQVWEKSYKLCLEVYKLFKEFPPEERYGLCSQLRRSSVSIPSNIAEGYGRRGRQEYIHFLYIAYGSYCELETQILLSSDLGYINSNDKERILTLGKEVERMLKGLITSLEKKSLEPSNP